MSNTDVRVSSSRETLPIDHDGPLDWPFEPFPASALEGSICERFAAIANRFPCRLAIRDSAHSLTYAELAASADRVACALSAAHATSGPIAILLRNDARFPAAILGALAAGRACVALDADHPLERNRRIAAHAGAAAVVSAAGLAAEARALFPENVPIVHVETLGEGVRHQSRTRQSPDDIAYIIYTSGSTGVPKGVFQNHRGVLHDILQSVNAAHISCADRIALFYTPSVIAGLRTMLTAILSGATVEVLRPAELGGSGLAREITARGVTVLRSSPTLFRHIVAALGPDARLDTVRLVSLGGERIDWTDFDVFRRGLPPNAKLSVHLGATECWTLHTHWYVDPALRNTHPHLPVGRSMPDRAVRVLREDGTPTKEGEAGEVVVSSRYIALGYWREPELTARSFASDPLDPLARLYHTGDLVRRLPDGLVQFVGREDQQIKLHGYRIELNEIEAALKACSGVSDAAVLLRCNEVGSPLALVGYVQLRTGERGLLPRHLLAMLGQRVPAYMMPAEIVLMEELPWLPNFKIDRKRLAQIDATQSAQRSDVENSPLVVELIQIFERLTKASGATSSDNLLSMGGDSLQAVQLALEIERRFQVTVPEAAHNSTRSIAEWANDIAAQRAHGAAGGAD